MNGGSRAFPETMSTTGFSRHIDCERLERETRPFLLTGFLGAILLGALLSRITFPIVTGSGHIAVRPRETIRVDLVPVRPRTVRPPLSVPVRRSVPPAVAAAPRIPEGRTPSNADSSRKVQGFTSRSILDETPEFAPQLGVKDSAAVKRAESPLRSQETREREFVLLRKRFGSVERKAGDHVFEAEKSPVDRGMQRFTASMPVSNPFSSKKRTPQSAEKPSGAADMYAGAYRKTPQQTLLEKLKEERFVSLTELDVRFLILMWRDRYCDAENLSPNDRSFLNRHRPVDTPSYTVYLQSMSKRGFVKPVAVDGRIVYEAFFSRGELLRTLSQAIEDVVNTTREADWLSLVSLVGSCYDFTQNRIVLPE